MKNITGKTASENEKAAKVEIEIFEFPIKKEKIASKEDERKLLSKAFTSAFASIWGVSPENILEIKLNRINEEDKTHDDEAVSQFFDFCDNLTTLVEEKAEIIESTIGQMDMKSKIVFENFMFAISTSDRTLPEAYKEYNSRENSLKRMCKTYERSIVQSDTRQYNVVIEDKTHQTYESALKDVKARLEIYFTEENRGE